jgi:hypothetical protein
VKGMVMLRVKIETTWDQIESLALVSNKLIFAITSGYWKIGNHVYVQKESKTPCGPRRETLISIHNPFTFLERAKNSIQSYGKWGLGVLLVSYHGNMVKENGFPSSMDTWDNYNELMDNTPHMLKLLNEANFPMKYLGENLWNLYTSKSIPKERNATVIPIKRNRRNFTLKNSKGR